MWSSGKYSSPTIAPPFGRHDLADLLVHHVRPDVVGRRHVEASCAPVSLHQPREERLDLLRRHRAGAEDQRVALLALVLLGVDVERLALVDGRALDRLPGRAVDAAEDDVDVDPAPRACAALAAATLSSVALSSTIQLDRPAEQAARGVDVVDHHLGDVGVGDAHERERAGLVGDQAHPDQGPEAWLLVSSCVLPLERVRAASFARLETAAARCCRIVLTPPSESIGRTPYWRWTARLRRVHRSLR